MSARDGKAEAFGSFRALPVLTLSEHLTCSAPIYRDLIAQIRERGRNM
jgi:hypothetical protein